MSHWEQEHFPAIAAEAKRVGATILFADEASIRSDYLAGTTGTIGKDAAGGDDQAAFLAQHVLGHKRHGAVSLALVHEGSATAKVFLEFLKRLMHDAKRPVFLIVDEHQIHKAKMVNDYVAAQKGRPRLFYLPPYSPHLNIDRQAWGNVEIGAAKRTITSKNNLKAKVISALRRLQSSQCSS